MYSYTYKVDSLMDVSIWCVIIPFYENVTNTHKISPDIWLLCFVSGGAKPSSFENPGRQQHDTNHRIKKKKNSVVSVGPKRS